MFNYTQKNTAIFAAITSFSVRGSVSQGQLFTESRYGDKFIPKLGAKCREQVVKLIFRAGIQRPFCVALICPLFSDG